MNLLVLLAVLAVFALLRFRRTGLLLWAGAWWVGRRSGAASAAASPDVDSARQPSRSRSMSSSSIAGL